VIIDKQRNSGENPYKKKGCNRLGPETSQELIGGGSVGCYVRGEITSSTIPVKKVLRREGTAKTGWRDLTKRKGSPTGPGTKDYRQSRLPDLFEEGEETKGRPLEGFRTKRHSEVKEESFVGTSGMGPADRHAATPQSACQMGVFEPDTFPLPGKKNRSLATGHSSLLLFLNVFAKGLIERGFSGTRQRAGSPSLFSGGRGCERSTATGAWNREERHRVDWWNPADNLKVRLVRREGGEERAATSDQKTGRKEQE